MTYNLTNKSISLTLAPGVAALLVPLNPNRRFLLLQVSGVNPAAFKFGSAPATAVDGFCLDGASAAGGQGGSFIFAEDSQTLEINTPVDSIYTYSALGTTVSATEGTVANFL